MIRTYPLKRPFGLGQAQPAVYTCANDPAPGSDGLTAYPVSEGFDPYLNCMRDARGNAVCSDGQRRPPG